MTIWSLGFLLVILPSLAIFYYILPQTMRSGFLAIASVLMLYSWINITTIPLLLLNCGIDYLLQCYMWEYQHHPERIHHALIFSWAKNGLFILLYGVCIPLVTLTPPTIGVWIVPLSASYYHLCLSRGEIPAQEKPSAFFCYCLFFGKITLGPLEHPRKFTPQLVKPTFNLNDVGEGITLIILALGKKVILYDNLLRVVREITDFAPQDVTLLSLVLWMFLSATVTYLYFSSLSNLAQGLGLIFSLKLQRNTYFPLQARGVYEYLYRFMIPFATLLEEELQVEDWSVEGVHKQRTLVAFILSCTIALLINPSMSALPWCLLMTLLVYLQTSIPHRVYLKIPSPIIRILTALITIPGTLLLNAPLNAIALPHGVYNNEILYVISSNYFGILIGGLTLTSLVYLSLQRLKEKFPISSSILSLLFSLSTLLVSISFMLMEVNT